MLTSSQRRLSTIFHQVMKGSSGSRARSALSSAARGFSSSSASAAAGVEAEPTVLVSNLGTATLLTLNRPKKLNALTLQMVRELTDGFKASDGCVNIMVGAGGKAFCAGGDVAAVRESGLGLNDHPTLTRDFFFEEYRLNNLIGQSNEKTPQVSVWDGITMGGGVGVSIHGKFRVCTEKVLFAKPETGIGLFPDVGASHFLGKMPGATGEYIALTGARLNCEDLIYSGLATHFVSSEHVESLCAALGGIPSDTPPENRSSKVESILDEFSSQSAIPDIHENSTLARNREAIDACFAAESVEGIIENLTNIESSDITEGNVEFARETLDTLAKMSPTSLKITLEQVRRGNELSSLGECLQMEFRMCQRLMKNRESDFYEGIRAVLVDRDGAPKWNPARLSDVSAETVQSYFDPLPEVEELHFDE